MGVPSPHRDFAAEAAADAAALFDQRPGDLEATRGLVDPRSAFMVWAEKQIDGWKVRVKCDAALSSEDAFKMAAEIQRLSDLIEGRAEF